MQPKGVPWLRGSVASWIVGNKPPQIVRTSPGVHAVWIPVRAGAFVVGPAPKPHGVLSAQQMDQLIQRAREGGYPDAIIGDYRVIVIGDAWQRPHLMEALRQLLAHNGLDQLTLVDRRPSWSDRLRALWPGPASSKPS